MLRRMTTLVTRPLVSAARRQVSAGSGGVCVVAASMVRRKCKYLLVFAAALFSAGTVLAMTELDDDVIAEVTGEGITFGWTDFRFLMDPESYIEQAGTANANTCTSTGNTAGNYGCWRRADIRWYGGNTSGWSTAVGVGVSGGAWNTTWTTAAGNMTQCANAGINGLGCPRGGPIAKFAPHDNPYLLRVHDYAGNDAGANSIGNGIVTYQGNAGSGVWDASSNTAAAGSAQTVLEWLAPTQQEYYRFSFWGEIEVGRKANGSNDGLLKSQTIVQGAAAGSKLRFYQFTQTHTSPGLAQPYNPALGAAGCTTSGCPNADAAGSPFSNKALAIVYESRLRGDFRLSVAQAAGPNDALGTPVEFHATEGMYFRNVDAWVPLGQSLYQALLIDMKRNTANNQPVTDGNFALEMPLIPNRAAVFTRFYSLNTGLSAPAVYHTWDYGYATARAAYLHTLPVAGGSTPNYMPARTAATITGYLAPDPNYFQTHGYSRWGDWGLCRGVGCRLPWQAANTAAQALAGIGRNAWNSEGDGIFFVGTSAYNAYAYGLKSVDVRSGNNRYTELTYYGGTGNKSLTTAQSVSGESVSIPAFTSCDAASATAYSTCGYGGDYLGATALGGKDTSAVSILPAERLWTNRQADGVGSATTRHVISVPAGTALNLGDAHVEGMQINYFKLTTLGAQY